MSGSHYWDSIYGARAHGRARNAENATATQNLQIAQQIRSAQVAQSARIETNNLHARGEIYVRGVPLNVDAIERIEPLEKRVELLEKQLNQAYDAIEAMDKRLCKYSEMLEYYDGLYHGQKEFNSLKNK